ncbi:phosphatase PAP2 family protein [Streptomyces sp. SP18CS02]|uniref:phosphatase PAP2 family protein n=1 Tax=Streptomyces sp. SP18CS02 TaxID=3002531 RepID=UPI002E77B37F|nr:phosphatase PAP2 family protein [Streptomyces sp. SP18CS02]MEE1752693.1 phosphatase PAP2 family protein [Streptomyces sp. SP18CS02]
MVTGSGAGVRPSWLVALVPVQMTLMVGLGIAVTSAQEGDRLTAVEGRVVRGALAFRGSTVDGLSEWFSALAGTEAVVGMTLVCVTALLTLSGGRRGREAAFLGAAVAVQSATFLVVTLCVQRPRPDVPHLDMAPPTSSFPSGHVGASVALYGGLAVLSLTRVRSAWRYAALVLLLVPAAVGLSRMYRGMHHPTDVVGGLVNGALTLIIVGSVFLSARSPGGERALHPAAQVGMGPAGRRTGSTRHRHSGLPAPKELAARAAQPLPHPTRSPKHTQTGR